MRYRMPVLAAGALAAALAFAPSTATTAAQPAKLDSFFVLDSTPFEVTLLAEAPEALAGAPADILFGEVPFQGMHVGSATLMPGPNVILAPNLGSGWFTAIGPFKPAKSIFEDLPSEQ